MSRGRTLALVALAVSGCVAQARADVTPPVAVRAAPTPRRRETPVTAADAWAGRCTLVLDGARSIPERLVEAYRERDVIKYLCVNDKLAQVEGLLRVMEERLRLIPVAAGEAEVLHQVAVVDAVCVKLAALRDEAEHCIGEEIAFAPTAP